jgi:hypothetical protein
MMEQDKFEEFVRTAINELDPRPEVPRDAMWARIDAARRFRRAPRSILPAWSRWGLGIAALLAVGFALGRLTLDQPTTRSVSERTADAGNTTATAGGGNALTPTRVAALRHLGRAEILLTSVRSGSVDAQVQKWADDMLITTRLLLDSPTIEESRVTRLLEDLELLLTQIASASGPTSPAELDLIQRGIEQTDVLPRLRAAMPATLAAGT